MANQPIKPGESALQNVLDLVDSQNPSGPTTAAQITISHLQIVNDPTNHPGADTSLELDAVAGQGYTGAVTIYYKRVALSTQVAAETGSASVLTTSTPAQVLAAVATHFNLILAEISWVTAPVNGNATGTIQASNSLVYEDGTASVALTWVAPSTKTLLHFEGANNSTTFTDETGRIWTPNGGSVISTAQARIGTGSFYNPGSANRYISTPDSADLKLTGDFTVEFWLYSSNPVSSQVLTTKGSGARLIVSSNAMYAYDDAVGTAIQGGSISPNVWNHIALVKSSGTTKIYVNGVSVVSSTSFGSYGNNAGQLVIGAFYDGTYPTIGYIDEFRISSIARYTANFTPSTTAFLLD